MEQPATDSAPRPRHHPGTASRVFGDEGVVITPAENMVRMLDEVGSRIWELADGTRTVDQIAAALTDEYDVSLDHARVSVTGFVQMLFDRGMLAWA
jgi:hypothetical protein